MTDASGGGPETGPRQAQEAPSPAIADWEAWEADQLASLTPCSWGIVDAKTAYLAGWKAGAEYLATQVATELAAVVMPEALDDEPTGPVLPPATGTGWPA